jgi:hypothetical protein
MSSSSRVLLLLLVLISCQRCAVSALIHAYDGETLFLCVQLTDVQSIIVEFSITQKVYASFFLNNQANFIDSIKWLHRLQAIAG